MRPLRVEDEAMYCALYTDPAVMAHIGAPLAPEAARRQFASARLRNADPAGEQRRWSVMDRASGHALGLVALLRDPDDAANAELGVMLLPAAHGRGMARELNDAVLGYAFGRDRGLRRVWARHATGHAAAAAALAASGFLPVPSHGGEVVVAATREDWIARNG